MWESHTHTPPHLASSHTLVSSACALLWLKLSCPQNNHSHIPASIYLTQGGSGRDKRRKMQKKTNKKTKNKKMKKLRNGENERIKICKKIKNEKNEKMKEQRKTVLKTEKKEKREAPHSYPHLRVGEGGGGGLRYRLQWPATLHSSDEHSEHLGM